MMNGTFDEWNTSFSMVNITGDLSTVGNVTWDATFDNVTVDWNLTALTTRAPFHRKIRKRCGDGYLFAMRVVTLGVLISFGVIGNILSALVMRHDIRTSATSLLFFVLAMVDIIVLAARLFAVCIPQFLIYFRITGREYRRFQYLYVDAYGQAFAYITQHWTAGMTVLVTVHRYLVVCKPTKAARFASTRAVAIQIGLVLLAITIYNIPLFFEWEVAEVYIFRRRMYFYRRRYTDMALTDSYKIFYRIVLLYLMLYVIPVSFLVILSYQLVKTVRKAAEKLKKMSNRRREKHDLTKTLVAIIICYVICQLPTPTDILIRELTPRWNRRCPYFFFYFTEWVDVGICFNSAFNFVLYCLFGKRFRIQLKTLLCCHRVRVQPIEATLEVTNTTQVATTGASNLELVTKAPGIE